MPREQKKSPELVTKCQKLRAQGKSYEEIAQELNVPSKSQVWKWLQTAETYLQDPEPHSTRHTFKRKIPEDGREAHLKIVNEKIVFYQKRTQKTKGMEREKNERLLLDFLKEHRMIRDDSWKEKYQRQKQFNIILKRHLTNEGLKTAIEEFKSLQRTGE